MSRFQFTIALIVLAVAGFIGGIVSSQILPTAAQADNQRQITAESLKIIDKNGNPVITLETNDDNSPTIKLTSTNKNNLFLCVGESGPSIYLINKSGDSIIMSASEGDTAVMMGNSNHSMSMEVFDEGNIFTVENDQTDSTITLSTLQDDCSINIKKQKLRTTLKPDKLIIPRPGLKGD